MAKATVKKAPVGKSSKVGGQSGVPAPAKLGKAHSSAKTVPSFNAPRMDKLENETCGSGGVKT